MGGFPAFLLSHFSFWHSGYSQTPTLSELEGCLGLFLSRRSSCPGPSFDQGTSNRTLLIFSRQRRSFYFQIELAECFSFVSQKVFSLEFLPIGSTIFPQTYSKSHHFLPESHLDSGRQWLFPIWSCIFTCENISTFPESSWDYCWSLLYYGCSITSMLDSACCGVQSRRGCSD